MWKNLIKKFKSAKKEFKIVIIGLDNSGKTTIIKYLRQGGEGNMDTVPTMGAAFHTIPLLNVKMAITDLGGQKEFRETWTPEVSKSDAIIFVVDVMDTERYEEAKREFDKAVSYLRSDSKVKIPICIAANKSDKLSGVTLSEKKLELIEYFKLNDFTNSKNTWQLELTSAVSGQGLVEVMGWLYSELTGKKDNILTIEDFMIFDKGGSPLISKSKILGANPLIASLMSLIQGFAQNISNGGIVEELTMKNYTILFNQIGEILGAIIVNCDGDIGSARTTLENLMQAFCSKEITKMDEQSLNNHFNQTVVSKIITNGK
jgi:small GTP-binding protein